MALEDIFSVAGSALNAQTTRMNTTASNLANAATVAGSEDGAFRAKRAVFKSILADQMGDSNAGGIKVEKLIDDPSPMGPVWSDRPGYASLPECSLEKHGWVREGVVFAFAGENLLVAGTDGRICNLPISAVRRIE